MVISFKAWLLEALHLNNDVHHDISATTLKRLAKHSEYRNGSHSAARFVISKDNKLHGADAHNFLHHDIHPTNQSEITGAVAYNHRTGKYTHEIYSSRDTFRDPGNHPKLKEMHDAAIKPHMGNYIL